MTTGRTMRTAAPAPSSTLLRVDMCLASSRLAQRPADRRFERGQRLVIVEHGAHVVRLGAQRGHLRVERSEEHTSELQSRPHLVCRLLLEKKKNHIVLEVYAYAL